MLSDSFKLVVTTAVVVILNEYVYYDESSATAANLALMLFGLGMLWMRSEWAFTFLVASVVLLNIRPRELHLVPLEMRGSFQYYSFAAQQVLGLSFHSWYMLIFGSLSLKSWSRNQLRVSLAVAGVVAVTTLIGLYLEAVVSWGIRSDLRCFVLLLLGLGISVSKGTWVRTSKFILDVAFLTLLTYVALDWISGASKFRYSPDVVMILPFLVTEIFRSKKFSYRRLLVPVSRTDIALYFLANVKNVRSLISVIILGTVALSALLYAQVDQSSFMGLIQRKASIVRDLEVDKSSSIRGEELSLVFEASIQDLMLGKGLGSYIDLTRMQSSMDLADFSERELNEAKGIQPHFFVSYLLLKYGILGSMVLIGVLVGRLRSLGFIGWGLSFGLLSGFYWIPFVAFIFGIILRNGSHLYSRT